VCSSSMCASRLSQARLLLMDRCGFKPCNTRWALTQQGVESHSTCSADHPCVRVSLLLTVLVVVCVGCLLLLLLPSTCAANAHHKHSKARASSSCGCVVHLLSCRRQSGSGSSSSIVCASKMTQTRLLLMNR
jgi:hypothetical protein